MKDFADIYETIEEHRGKDHLVRFYLNHSSQENLRVTTNILSMVHIEHKTYIK